MNASPKSSPSPNARRPRIPSTASDSPATAGTRRTTQPSGSKDAAAASPDSSASALRAAPLRMPVTAPPTGTNLPASGRGKGPAPFGPTVLTPAA
jgi:hypothetical protein